jgi:Cys-Gly metallodipeptidase DUG1
MEVEYLHGGKPWVADVRHWNFEAAKKAIEVRLRHQFSSTS